MANLPLQEIVFPGLSNVYKVPVVDATLTQTGAAADAKKTGDEIGALKNDLTNGTFPVGNAENADQLTSTVGIEDKTPYLFRTSGGSNDIGDREDMKKIVGGTVAWNQLVNNGNFADTSGWGKSSGASFAVSGNVATVVQPSEDDYIIQSFALIQGHKYFRTLDCKFDTRLKIGTNGELPNANGTGDWQTLTTIASRATTGNVYLIIKAYGDTFPSEGTTFYVRNAMYCDLTLALGSSIADYVYNLETATAGAGVAWLKTHFPKQFDAGYQAYDAGSMQSVSGLTEHKMVGFNQWNEQWELGTINTSTGAKEASSTRIRSKNYIPVLSGNTYAIMVGNGSYATSMRACFYDSNFNFVSGIADFPSASTSGLYPHTFTVPSNAVYMLFSPYTDYGTTYNHDICINLSWDGERDGEYEPYVEYTYPLDPSLTLRGIPKLDSANNLYYDGDTYESDGTVTRRYGTYILDGSTQVSTGVSDMPFRFILSGFKYPTVSTIFGNIVTDRLKIVKQADTWGEPFTLSAVSNSNYVYFKLSEAITTVEDAKTYLTDNPITIVYEKATPTTETALPYQETQIVDDFGTEEFILADGAFPVPVGHNTMYQNNLRAKLEMSPDSPDGDGLYVVQQESGENTYVPLASTSTIQDILTRLTALENA